eukprot:scaffold587_cov339-Pavlova_lutheri.AAC.1
MKKKWRWGGGGGRGPSDRGSGGDMRPFPIDVRTRLDRGDAPGRPWGAKPNGSPVSPSGTRDRTLLLSDRPFPINPLWDPFPSNWDGCRIHVSKRRLVERKEKRAPPTAPDGCNALVRSGRNTNGRRRKNPRGRMDAKRVPAPARTQHERR